MKSHSIERVLSRMWAVWPNGRGDVTDTHVAWTRAKQIPKIPSPILVHGRIYTNSDGGIVQQRACY